MTLYAKQVFSIFVENLKAGFATMVDIERKLYSEDLPFLLSSFCIRVATWAETCAVAPSMDGTQEGVSPPAELKSQAVTDEILP